MHQLENHVQIPTTCSHVLCSGSGEELDLPLSFKISWILQVSFFRSKSFKISWPQWRVTINNIFFAMALSDDTYQLLIVLYVLASSHDLVTVSVHRPASKDSHTVSLTQTQQAGRAPLLETANDKLGIWGHWDSHFHVGLQWLYTHWLGLRRISSFKKNVQVCLPHWRPGHSELELYILCNGIMSRYKRYKQIIDCFSCAFIWSWPCDLMMSQQAAHQLQLHVLELGQHVQQVSTTS